MHLCLREHVGGAPDLIGQAVHLRLRGRCEHVTTSDPRRGLANRLIRSRTWFDSPARFIAAGIVVGARGFEPPASCSRSSDRQARERVLPVAPVACVACVAGDDGGSATLEQLCAVRGTPVVQAKLAPRRTPESVTARREVGLVVHFPGFHSRFLLGLSARLCLGKTLGVTPSPGASRRRSCPAPRAGDPGRPRRAPVPHRASAGAPRRAPRCLRRARPAAFRRSRERPAPRR